MLTHIREVVKEIEDNHKECRMRNLEDDSPFESSFHAGQIHAYGVVIHLLRNSLKKYANEVPVIPLELMDFISTSDL